VITPQLLSLFDKRLNDEWKRVGAANTPLAHYLGVDFTITKSTVSLDEPYNQMYSNGEISQKDLDVMLRERKNIASEYRITLTVRKI